jgi:phosphate transport system substrate-binding protein
MTGGKNVMLKKTLVLLSLIIFGATILSGCVEESQNGGKTTVSIKGSSTVLPIAETCAEEFMNLNSSIQVTVAGGGSSVGIRSVAEGEVDIGDASREKKESDVKNEDGTYKYTKADGTPVTLEDLVDHVIAYDGIAVVVSPNIYTNNVTGLTMEEVYQIYTGEITNWNEVGGPDLEIFVNDRASTSGTRATFIELIENSTGYSLQDFEEDGNDLAVYKVNQENSNVVDAVSGSNKAIGYVGLGYVNEQTCPAVTIDGVLPSVQTVTDGAYPISRSLHMYTLGEATGTVLDFIEYVQGEAGQAIVVEEGFVSIL